MPLTTIGLITLGGVTFSTDPRTYESLNWAKRFSIQQGLGGAVTIQDFGTFQKDNTLRLSSGGNFIDTTNVNALHALFRTKGVSFTLTDWLDNEFVVFIMSFRPVIATGLKDLWNYDMDLRVLSIVKLNGVTFTGP